MSFTFTISAKEGNARSGTITTPHGDIKTPAFIPVGTKATVKSLTPEQVHALGAQAVLSNTYHLYLQPGSDIIQKAGGLGAFMNWKMPTFTDSGGFQAFSLGTAFERGGSKLQDVSVEKVSEKKLATVTEDGVTFKSVLDGSTHIFTPEKSIEIQHEIGADIIFVFDECTSPSDKKEYQKEAIERTHRWAKRCLVRHDELNAQQDIKQALFGIVQGGPFEDLRKESAAVLGSMNFDGYGIGGSFSKQDIGTAVGWVNHILPENKPRHLLGIGEPEDVLLAIAEGCDTFDCVAATRQARNGSAYTKNGRLNLRNSICKTTFEPIDTDCDCYTCINYTQSYIAHLFRADELLAHTLMSIHNLRYIIKLVDGARLAIEQGVFEAYKIQKLEELRKQV